MIIGCSTWWPTYYKKSTQSLETRHLPRNEKVQLNISKYHYFEYSHEHKGVVKTSEFIRSTGFQSLNTFILKKTNEVSSPSQEAYPEGKVPIKKSKIEDLKKIMHCIVEEHKSFYDQLLQWPVADISLDDDE